MHRSDLHPYDSGFTPWMTSRMNPRFSLCLYVPESTSPSERSPLLVLVHGTTRRDWMRDSFRDFAERTGTALLLPLFPVGAAAPDDVHGFKWIDAHDVRYDLLLLDMIEQAAEIWPIATNRFALFGYSGGGQFAHRFLYLHPHRLTALSIGAPGNVTLPDFVRAWPAGLRGLEERFGGPIRRRRRAGSPHPPGRRRRGHRDLGDRQVSRRSGLRRRRQRRVDDQSRQAEAAEGCPGRIRLADPSRRGRRRGASWPGHGAGRDPMACKQRCGAQPVRRNRVASPVRRCRRQAGEREPQAEKPQPGATDSSATGQ